jgi:hypothetical protein
MPLYIQSFYHPDYQSTSRTTVEVKDIGDRNTSSALSKDYFLSTYVGGIFPYNFYQTYDNYIYIPFEYKAGASAINPASIGAQTIATVLTSARYPSFLYRFTYSVPPYSEFKVNANELTVIIINKFYCNFRDVFYDQYKINESEILQNDTIYINFSFAKLVSLDVTVYGDTQTIDFLIKSKKTYDYVEDFSEKIFYSDSAYYTDAGLTDLANLKVRREFFPFLLINNNSSPIRGKVKTTLEFLDDLNLIDLGQDLNANDYVDITPTDPPNINQNTITCSVSSPGYADVVYNGLPYSYSDQQICGSPPVVDGNPIAIIRRDNEFDLAIYESFLALTSETVSIYANNFRYIKYVTLVNNVTTYTAFKDNGPVVASSTVGFFNEVLNLNNYNSLKEDENGNILGITFQFVIYKSIETEAGALIYNLTIPVSVYAPEIVSASYNADKTKLEIISNYASSIKYYLKGDSSIIQTVSVTDLNALNQRTLIDIDFDSKSINANAYGFFYDFNNGAREPYKSLDFSQSIDFDINIQSFALQLKNGSPLFTFRTFYDSSNAAITNLVLAPCSTSSFDNYKTYLNYADVYDVIFAFVFTLGSGFKSLFLEIGEGTDKYELTNLINIPISRNELFNRADINGRINLTVWLDNKIPFIIPFQFLNFSTNAPQIVSVNSPIISGESKVSASFSFSYRYADLVSYSILDQDNSVVYGPVILPKKSYSQLFSLFSSGSTASEAITTDIFDIQPGTTSLKVAVTAGNLTSTFPFDLQSVSLQSSATSLPQQLNRQTPAEVKFYSDQAMSPGTEATYISRGVTYYAFLQLKDVNGNDIDPINYGNYISINPPPEFKAVESQDLNEDLNGVSVTRINDYLYSFKISPSSPFNDSAFVLDITYSPIIAIPTKEDNIGGVTNS